jgi:hypothetical protein
MRFKSKVDWFYKSIIGFITIVFSFAIYSSILTENTKDVLIMSLIFLLILGFLVYIPYSTYFVVTETHLVCSSFYFWKVVVSYDKIRKVEKQKGLFVGWKMATSITGLILTYNKYDELFISPEKEALFMELINEKIDAFQYNKK